MAQAAWGTTRYVVEGVGFFPFDMLRYDGSYPYGSTDVAAMGALDAARAMETRQVELAHVGSTRPTWLPTIARWRSFGWRVVYVTDPNGRHLDTSERRA